MDCSLFRLMCTTYSSKLIHSFYTLPWTKGEDTIKLTTKFTNLITGVSVPGVGAAIFTTAEYEWPTWSDVTVHKLAEVERADILLYHRLHAQVQHTQRVVFGVNQQTSTVRVERDAADILILYTVWTVHALITTIISASSTPIGYGWYCIRKNNCDWALNAIFEKLIFLHSLYIPFIFQKVCTSFQKLQDRNFYSLHLFLNRAFCIYFSRIYLYVYSIRMYECIHLQTTMESGRHAAKGFSTHLEIFYFYWFIAHLPISCYPCMSNHLSWKRRWRHQC